MLPNGYKQLEYLQSTGTQYINTGIETANTIEYDVKFSIDNIGASRRVIGGHPFPLFYYRNTQSQSDKAMVLYIDSSAHGIYSTQKFSSVFTAVVKAHRESGAAGANTSYIQINNDAVQPYPAAASDYTSFYPVFLFNSSTISGTPTSEGLIGKIYYAKIYIDNVLVRDMVPALNSDNTPGMYDFVSKQFYTNQGTGTFTYPSTEISAVIHPNGGGGVSGVGLYDVNSIVLLDAIPAPGFIFERAELDSTVYTENPIEWTVTEDTEFDYYFRFVGGSKYLIGR